MKKKKNIQPRFKIINGGKEKSENEEIPKNGLIYELAPLMKKMLDRITFKNSLKIISGKNT